MSSSFHVVGDAAGGDALVVHVQRRASALHREGIDALVANFIDAGAQLQ